MVLLSRAPGRVGAWLVVVAGAWWVDAWSLLAALLAGLVVPAAWSRVGPASFSRWVSGPWWRRTTRRRLRASWPQLMRSCGLALRVPGPAGQQGVQVPGLGRLGWRGGQLVAVPRLLVGQTVDDVQDAADRLRVAVGARRVRVVPNEAATACEVVWLFGDPLAEPFNATVPDRSAPVQLESAVMGRTEDGDRWRLDLRVSTLVAGSAGSGKASAMWGLMLALAPGIRAGLVEVAGIDLKGGMELAMGRALFTRYATDPVEAMVVLEDTARALQGRARAIAGLVRTHEPTTADPLQVVLVDELAALTAYVTDRDLLRRAETALSLILSQGRAPGFYVFGFVQDPRKETVKMRHLFPQSFGLRLRDREEVAMVLGDGAIAAGAACHKIGRSTPGVGYVLAEDGRVLRVRAGYVTDPMIRELAAHFPAPRQIPVDVPATDQGAAPRRTRRAPAGEGVAA
jgi:S-DNA-T family DNA segregation ATPase FtsK/SpoIIIE